MRLLLIRHGRQCSPLCNVDVALSEEGKRQAELLAERLQTRKPDLIFTSGLLRAKQTAVILFGENTAFWEREELNEISFGNLTGKSDVDTRIEFAEYYAAKKRKELDLRIPGGECPTEVFARASKVVSEAVAAKVETVAFVTHGGVIRALTAGLLGIGAERMLLFADGLEHCSITELSYDESTGLFSLERINDYAHMEKEPELLRNAWKK